MSLRLVEDAPGRVDAVEAGHVDVHDDDVRSERERSSTASSPVAASPTTSVSATDSSSARRPPRKSGWSSAMRIRIGRVIGAVASDVGRGNDAVTSVPPPVPRS